MSGLLFGFGAVAVVVGVVMVGFGIPINEFSFGNTLISAGTTAILGGLIIVALGIVAAQLQRLTEALATRTPIRSSKPLDLYENAADSRAAPAMGRIPFPPKPKADARMRAPYPLEPSVETSATADMPAEEQPEQSFVPTLPNPDEPPVTVEDDVSLSPRHPMAAPAPAADDRGEPAPEPPALPLFGAHGTDENRHEPGLDAGWREPRPPAAPEQTRQPHAAYFDAMWPAEPKPAKPAATEAQPFEPTFDLPPREAAAEPTEHAEPEAPALPPEHEPRSVAILKSGVVDGMGYTLYVDGSIEAELPQGTLRFASINELRSHLEQNS